MATELRIGLLAATAVGWVMGCHAIFGLTEYEVASTTAAGGSGGSGGGAPTCTFPEDCPGNDGTCRFRACDDGVCGMGNASDVTVCTDEGGVVCDGEGNCVECNRADQCDANFICQDHLCVSNVCGNNQQDAGETGIDCGGSCAPCANGVGCLTYADCQSQYCAASTGTGGGGGAGAATGGSGVGGGTGGAAPQLGVCAPCTGDGQCAPVVPTAWCDPNDNGGSCVDQLDDGDVCERPEQCTSGFCPAGSGVCCESACTDVCQSCLGTATGGANGSCAAMTNCDCTSQYGTGGDILELCAETVAECLFRYDDTSTNCRDFCRSRGGECVRADNDNNNVCDETITGTNCNHSGWLSMMCVCSHGCGAGPPCTAPQVCTGGVCG